jgi:hypothetical protein
MYTVHLLTEHLNTPHTGPDHFFYTLKARQYHERLTSKLGGRPAMERVPYRRGRPIKRLAQTAESSLQVTSQLPSIIKHKVTPAGKSRRW